MSTYTKLKGVNRPGECLVSEQLEANLAHFFTWAFTDIGGFLNVERGQQGGFGGDQSRLQPLSDPRNVTNNTVWQGHRKDWIYESGLECDRQPIDPSGVWVDNAFYPTASTSGAYQHTIDYPNGRVIFSNAVPATKVVQCEHSYRLYGVSTSDVPWFREIQTNSMRADDTQFTQPNGSGAWAVLSEMRVQLPQLIVHAVPKTQAAYGKEIGSLTQVTIQEVQVHILTETKPDLMFLHDSLIYQREKTLIAYDKNLVLANNKLPLSFDGSKNASGLDYPALVDTYPWQKIRIASTQSSPLPNLNPSFWRCTVRLSVEAYTP